MNSKNTDFWAQLLSEHSWREPDSPLQPAIETLLTIAHRIETDRKNGVDSNASRITYFVEAGILRRKGAPSNDESLLRVRIKKSAQYQQALLVMIEERGITTDKNTVDSVLATNVLFQDSQILSPYRTNEELAKLPDEDAEERAKANSTFVEKLYKEHQSKSVISTYKATKRVSAWRPKERKSLENAHRKYHKQIVLSEHFHAYMREQEVTPNN